MEYDAEIKGAQKTIELAEKLEALTKSPGWKEYIALLDQLMWQEERALRGMPLTKKYYKKIGFLQMTQYIRSLPGIVKDKGVREYLEHQGRSKALETASGGIFGHYQKQKAFAIQKLKQMFGARKEEKGRGQFNEEVFKNQG